MNEREIFEAALDRADAAERQAFLEQSCGADMALRARIEALLASHESASQFLNVAVPGQLQSLVEGNRHPDANFGNADDESDADGDAPAAPDFSFLQPSTKPGSIGALGSYEILEVLGQGAFGIVFKAFDEKLRRLVAIKVMNPQLAGTSPPRKRFLREARSAAAIKHENIVQVYTVEEQPLPYLVMEYIDGQNLQQKLDTTGPLDVLELLHLGRQMASGLAAAHAQGLIHRDIKPGNILLEKGAEQKVKITDFGLARTVDDASMTRTGFVSGTPLYMAPEQALGLPLDHRGDLFSLGSVLYQMASGRAPFRAPSAIAVLKRVTEDRPRPIQEIIPEVPGWLCAIIAKLHAKKPEERFTSAAEVAQLLGSCLTEMQLHGRVESEGDALPVIPKPASTVRERAKLPARNNRRIWWSVGATVIVALLIGLAMSVTRKNGQQAADGGSHAKPPVPVAGDPDRRAAEYALSIGAKVRIHNRENEEPFEVQALPKEDFMLAEVDFVGNKQVTDAGLACVTKCRNLKMFGVGYTAKTDAGLAGVTDAGLAGFEDCPQLEVLSLVGSGITDAGLLHFAGCKNLKRVWLANSQISDRGLAMFKGSKALLSIQLDHLPVSYAGLENFADAKDLEILILHSCDRIDDRACSVFKNCKKLKRLILFDTKVGDAGVEQFTDCKDLTELNLHNSRATGAVIALLDNWPKLNFLHLEYDPVSDAQLAQLKEGNHLRELRIRCEGISDAGVKNIARCTELVNLVLESDKITNDGLNSLAGLEKLRWLGLHCWGKPGITTSGVKKLAAALPDCKIEWYGGTIVPPGWRPQ